jgi:hypothetical protein
MLIRHLSRKEERTAEVDRQDQIEIGQGFFRNPSIPRDTGHVDDSVDTAARLEDLAHRTNDIVFRGYIGRYDEGRNLGFDDPGSGLLEATRIEIDHCDLSSMPRERFGHRESDALGGACDDMGFSEKSVLAQNQIHESYLVLR